MMAAPNWEMAQRVYVNVSGSPAEMSPARWMSMVSERRKNLRRLWCQSAERAWNFQKTREKEAGEEKTKCESPRKVMKNAGRAAAASDAACCTVTGTSGWMADRERIKKVTHQEVTQRQLRQQHEAPAVNPFH